jgi:hypothetical protein
MVDTFHWGFSSGVSVVQKLNVGFTVSFTEIQHYKQQAPPTRPPARLGADHAMPGWAVMRPTTLESEVSDGGYLPCNLPALPRIRCLPRRPPESVWAQLALTQWHWSGPVLQFLHIVVFLFLFTFDHMYFSHVSSIRLRDGDQHFESLLPFPTEQEMSLCLHSPPIVLTQETTCFQSIESVFLS